MRTKLTDVPRTLAAQTGRPAPAGSYARLWRAVADGRLPAEREGAAGWRLRDEHMPAAARLLGMTAD